ncbi:MAG TPA: hypothetical protein VF607_10555 [Verrucomicrobiae bacterium]
MSILCGVLWLETAHGQVRYLPDMAFAIHFTPDYPYANGDPEYNLIGQYFYQELASTEAPAHPARPNSLYITTSINHKPSAAELWQKNSTGRMVKITDLVAWQRTNSYDASTIVQQRLELKPDQVRALVDGRLYLLLRHGTNQYWGQFLTEKDDAISGPDSHIDVLSPKNYLISGNTQYHTVITHNLAGAAFVMDGRRTQDPYYLPITTYNWSVVDARWYMDLGGVTNDGTTPYFTYSVGLGGAVWVHLQADDVVAAGEDYYVYLEVIHPEEATWRAQNELMSLDANSVSAAVVNNLWDTLTPAAQAFDRGDYQAGAKQLRDYQQLILHSRLPVSEVQRLNYWVSAILDSLRADQLGGMR